MNNILNTITENFESFKSIFDISSLTLLIFFILSSIIIYLFILTISLKKKLDISSNINLNNNLVNEINTINEKINTLNSFKISTTSNIEGIFKELKKSNTIKLIKYNPYSDMGVGGNQSFSVSFLDKNGDGLILTSLYSREKSRSLIKKIEKFHPEKELTPEEQDLLSLSKL